jgi:hypothetical protein
VDVVYPYQRRGDEFELRYSLRSLVAYMPHDRVIVSGDKPAFATGITLVQEWPQSDRFRSSTANIAAAIRRVGITGSFVVMNDDFFLLKRWKYRHAHRGTIDEYLTDSKASGAYRAMVARTKDILTAHGVANPLFFGLHKPTVYDSRKLLELLTEFRREKFLLRTLYGNLFPSPSVKRSDVKLHTWPDNPPTGDVFSTSDQCAKEPACRAWLQSRFPEPTTFEKPRHLKEAA